MTIACVAAGQRTRLNPLYSLYTEGLERLRRRLDDQSNQESAPGPTKKSGSAKLQTSFNCPKLLELDRAASI